MHVTILPSSLGQPPAHLFTSYLINGSVAIDAGCLGMAGSLAEMARIKHVFLTHSHLDHVAALGPFLDAVYDGSGDCVVVYGNAHVLDCLRKDVFNNRLYPDFLHISTFRPPYLRMVELADGQTVEANGVRVTAVAVDHVVPTFGYVVEDGEAAVVFPSDTGPTEAIWDVARKKTTLKAVFLECTFPGDMAWLAEIAKHLTPSLFEQQLRKLGREVRTVVVHVHPRQVDRVTGELMALGLPGVEIGEAGREYVL